MKCTQFGTSFIHNISICPGHLVAFVSFSFQTSYHWEEQRREEQERRHFCYFEDRLKGEIPEGYRVCWLIRRREVQLIKSMGLKSGSETKQWNSRWGPSKCKWSQDCPQPSFALCYFWEESNASEACWEDCYEDSL